MKKLGRYIGLFVLCALVFAGLTYVLSRLTSKRRWLIFLPAGFGTVLAVYFYYGSLRPSDGLLDIARRLAAFLFFGSGLVSLAVALWIVYIRGKTV